MRKQILVVAAGIIIVLAMVTVAVAADPIVGTWKMNPAKSKFSNPALKSYTVTFSAQENGNKGVENIVGADGKAFQRSWAVKYDGKDYPVIAPDIDSLSVKKPDANTGDFVCKKSGKEMWRGQEIVSKDGKTCILKGSGKDEKGQAFTFSIFLEKQ
jgi:hypothetical protein